MYDTHTARPTDPDDFSPEAARQVLHSSISLSEKCHGKRAHVLLSSIDPCPSLARPLAYERLGAIVEWFEKLGAAVLFSIIVQTSALDEARYQVVDGSHRFQVARIIVDPRRVSELPPEITAEQRTELRQRVEKLNKLHPRSGRRTTSTWPFTTLDPEAMLELQHRVNLLTHDARFGSSTFDVLLNLKRASLQVCPKRYIREDPDFATHLEPALKELHFPKGEDAPAKLVKILECFSLEMLCALSQLPVERQPSATNLWRIFEARDAEMNRWLARAMLEGSFSGSEATSTAAADLKKPIRQAEQTFMLLEAHDAAEVAAGDHPPVLYLPPDEAAREILRCHLVRTETFAFMNCLNVRPFPFRKGKVRLPAFSEELGELGCPFERLNETDVGNMPQEITFMDGRRLSEFELVLGYWLGWCAAQLPPAMQDYLMPEHCPYARLWEEMGHHDIPRASKRMLKTVDRELREERRALREEAASEHPEPPKSEPAKRATLKALLSQAEPTSEAEAKAAEADDEYEVKACALPPESATEEAQPSAMACEITAVNDDLDDATIAFIEKHASILDEEDPFLCFIDELDDHRAIFRSMDQLSRLSFTSTMIPEFGKLFGYLVASEKRIPSTKLLQRISLSILRSAGGDQSLCCQKLAQLIQFICGATIFNLESSSKPVTVSRVSMATPVPARPVASVNPSTASPQSGLCPKSPSTVKQPPGKVTAHCIDPSAAPLQLGGGTSRPLPDGTWGRGCPTPKKSQCKGIVFLSVQSFVPLFSLFLIYLLDPPYSLVPSSPVLFYLSLSP
ncbi:hypothetical protein PAPYR_12394 [Paratrimastix pyriformis]|uniref:ParB/Sulfiredoxin domain-containing protein n=1 Tax=Paratrimastix pyriformis TaxID=342808 RepID=A0ABQ8U5N4_9EUKA|nr:hypothetical protein PAPYR_12394 [Paratrimastix pyriformis]